MGVTGISLQLSGRLGRGLDPLLCKLAGYKRAVSKAGGRDGARPLQEWREHLSVALAKYIAATALSATGHKEFCAVLLNAESKTETETEKKKQKQKKRNREKTKKRKTVKQVTYKREARENKRINKEHKEETKEKE